MNVLLIQLCLLIKLKIKTFRKQTRSSCIFQWSYIHDEFLLFVFGVKCIFSQPFVCLSGSGKTNQSNAVCCARFFIILFQEQIGENSIATRFFLQSLRVCNECMDVAARDENVEYKKCTKNEKKKTSIWCSNYTNSMFCFAFHAYKLFLFITNVAFVSRHAVMLNAHVFFTLSSIKRRFDCRTKITLLYIYCNDRVRTADKANAGEREEEKAEGEIEI